MLWLEFDSRKGLIDGGDIIPKERPQKKSIAPDFAGSKVKERKR